MADEITPNAGEVKPEDIQKNNAEVAAKLAAQDINGQATNADDDVFADTSSALDKLREQSAKKEEGDAPAPEAKPSVEAKPAAEAKPTVEEKSAAESKPAAEEKPAHDELFKGLTLPAGASPKSSEAFAAVKLKASQELARREEEIAKLSAQLKERDEKLKDPVPPELQSELKELREFRAKFDIEADPKFKTFDQSIDGAREFIYAQLKKSPNITDDVIAAIKKYGGPENVKMEKIFEAINDPTTQRLIESRLAEIEQQKFNKEQAIATAKKNVTGYIEERSKAMEEGRTAHNSATKAELEKLRENLSWMKPVTVDQKATDEQKKAAEAHNAFVKDVEQQIGQALNDDTPQMRAIMLAGMAQLFFVRDRYAVLKQHAEGLEKQVAELNGKLEKFKGASVSRLEKSAAAKPNTALPSRKDDTDIFSQKAGDALDSLRAKVIEEQARAAAGQ